MRYVTDIERNIITLLVLMHHYVSIILQLKQLDVKLVLTALRGNFLDLKTSSLSNQNSHYCHVCPRKVKDYGQKGHSEKLQYYLCL